MSSSEEDHDESPVASEMEEDEEMMVEQPSETESDSDNDDDPSTSEEGSDDNDDGNLNEGWANSMSRVLAQQPKTSKSVILSKVKKGIGKKEPEKKSYGFEIEGEIKDEKPDSMELIEAAVKIKLLEKRKVYVKLKILIVNIQNNFFKNCIFFVFLIEGSKRKTNGNPDETICR